MHTSSLSPSSRPDWQTLIQSEESEQLSSEDFQKLCVCAQECLALSSVSADRAIILRAVESNICTPEHVELVSKTHMSTMISRSIEAKPARNNERVFALRCALAMARTAPHKFPVQIVRTLKSVCNDTDDAMTVSCLHLLVMLCALNMDVVVHADAMRILISASANPSFNPIQKGVLITLLHAGAHPTKRVSAQPGKNLLCMLSPITDELEQSSSPAFKQAIQALHTMLLSWTGLCYLCSRTDGMPAVVGMLRMRGQVEKKTAIVNLIFDVLQQTVPNISTVRYCLKTRSSLPSVEDGKAYSPHTRLDEKLPGPMDAFYSVLLSELHACNVIDTLVELAQTTESEDLAVLSTFLVVQLLKLSDSLLPVDMFSDVQSLPKLFNTAASFRSVGALTRSKAFNILHEVHQLFVYGNKKSDKQWASFVQNRYEIQNRDQK